ncbi:BTAD domain-containing putative transcriptional regulator [Streptomyces sp. WZ-12]|uniref:BTAD domain-containing putative transcriptional regulator n=1 Tax=Streptomyces sp. WZ-12 TaxID=3030210 RepID=UPI0023813107|nr:BTAD domain-containing putative transcriptional regulator [Streptomyces sp. WZ-12]
MGPAVGEVLVDQVPQPAEGGRVRARRSRAGCRRRRSGGPPALAVSRDVRSTLSDELGISPGPRLTGIEGAILRQDLATLQPCGV